MLFDGAGERVTLERWLPDAGVEVANRDGLELLVLDGGFHDGTDDLRRWSWLRLPAGMHLTALVGAKGAQLWIKAAPLLHADVMRLEDAEG